MGGTNNFDPQTTFVESNIHFSETHQNHWFGSTYPVQQHVDLRMPDKSLERISSVPVFEPFQTKLTDFNDFKKTNSY